MKLKCNNETLSLGRIKNDSSLELIDTIRRPEHVLFEKHVQSFGRIAVYSI